MLMCVELHNLALCLPGPVYKLHGTTQAYISFKGGEFENTKMVQHSLFPRLNSFTHTLDPPIDHHEVMTQLPRNGLM